MVALLVMSALLLSGTIRVAPEAGTASAATTKASSTRFFGAYVSGAPASMTPVSALESKIGRAAAVVHFYVADSESFPQTRATAIRTHGSTPMITWEFWSTQKSGVASINNGSKDAYIRTFARASKAFGTTIWLRPFHEMNGNWYPWCGTVGRNSPAQVVSAFRRVRRIFTQEGATNVRFVWSPNNDSVSNTNANRIAAYWPGNAYIDYMAIDGYNFGGSSRRSFSTTFKSSYKTVTALSAKPLFIAETACSPSGGSKSGWVSEMFRCIPASFPRVKGIVWFNTNKECDWRIESDAATLKAFKVSLARF